MIYNTITLSITNKCNADCPICCFACDPQNSEVLEDSVLENTINSLKEDKNIQCIAISGGEPFLYPEKVFYIANLT